MVNVPSSLNNLKSKLDDLDVDKLKFSRIDLKKIKWCCEERSCKKDDVQQTKSKSK